MSIKQELATTVQADLELMISAAVQEGQRLDFKQEYPTQWNDKAKHSLAADAVAFANSSGGVIVYGIEQGLSAEALKINPQPILSIDDERLKLHSFLSDLVEPSLPGVETHAVPVNVNGVKGYVVLVRVPQSWVGPHRSKMGNNFLIRDGVKNKPLDVPEIRSQFLNSENRAQKLRNFRTERLSKVLVGDTPFKLITGAVLVVHVVPIQAIHGQVAPDIVQYNGLRRGIPVITTSSGAATHKINLDGAAGARPLSSGATHGYSLIFRNGFIESTWVQTTNNPDGKPAMPSGSFEGFLKNFVEAAMRELKHWNVSSEALVMVSLLRAHGMRLAYSGEFSGGGSGVFDRDVLAFPEFEVLSVAGDYMSQMRAMIDVIWQSAGFEKSPNFDAQGNWTPPRTN